MRVFPPPQHLRRGMTSCPSAELFIPSKHSVIDAAANQDSDHTVMLLQLTEAVSQILTGALLPHKTHFDDSVFCISLWIYFQILRRIFFSVFLCSRSGMECTQFQSTQTTSHDKGQVVTTSHPLVLAHVTWWHLFPYASYQYNSITVGVAFGPKSTIRFRFGPSRKKGLLSRTYYIQYLYE